MGKKSNYAELRGYKKYGKFKTVKEFNNHFEQMMIDLKSEFTKSEYIALNRLRKFAGSEIIGVSWVKAQTVVAATGRTGMQISRRTFDRMLTKAKKFNILQVIHQKQNNGWQAHNLYVFNRYEEISKDGKVVRIDSSSTTNDKTQFMPIDAPLTTPLLKLPRIEDKEITYATHPSATKGIVDDEFKEVELTPYEQFKKHVSQFVNDKNLTQKLWGIWLAHTNKLITAPEVDVAVNAIKQTMWKFKNGVIKKGYLGITGYFNGTVSNMIDKFMIEQLREAQDEYVVFDEPLWDEDNAENKTTLQDMLDVWGLPV